MNLTMSLEIADFTKTNEITQTNTNCIDTFLLVLFSEDLDRKDMQKEALNRRNAWEQSFFYSLGNETFFFSGQEISIRESLDSFGAVIWPGVRTDIFIFLHCPCYHHSEHRF